MAEYRTANGNFAKDRRVERLDLPVGDREATAVRLELIARMMDSAIRIPGTNVAMGLDALLGLLPVVGDAIAGAISSYLVWEAKRLGVPRTTLMRMAGNVAIDTLLGSIPVLGDIFDVAYKANIKNVALLRRHLAKQDAGSRIRDTIEVPYTRI